MNEEMNKSNNRGLGVEAIIEHDLRNNPHCSHGPTIAFERYTTSGMKTGRRFYACSACRDRKDCPFFQWVDQPSNKNPNPDVEDKTADVRRKRIRQIRRLKTFRNLPLSKRRVCITCTKLLMPEEWQKHAFHEYKSKVENSALKMPSSFLPPLENSRNHAQYLFSEKTVMFLISTLERMNFERVLCIGAPRIHEYICSKKCGGKLTSLLLDIDERFGVFYGPKKFCLYNMFNHYFFGGAKEENIFQEFLGRNNGEKIAIITDPPFGGLIDVISHWLQKINETWRLLSGKGGEEIPLMWIFPYFNEARILQCMPSLKMLDYRVDYENHPLFRADKRKVSPVRIFTNMNPSLFVLPEDEYRYCEICQCYVSNDNKHCEKCSACTSKDGRHPYHHCDVCDRCVKSSYRHCDSCGRCMHKDHECGKIVQNGCHVCGDIGHKRKECPNRGLSKQKKRRMK